MAELKIQVRITKTVWYHVLRFLANMQWAIGIRKTIAKFVAKHKLCVCLLRCGNEITFYTIQINGEEIEVVGID